MIILNSKDKDLVMLFNNFEEIEKNFSKEKTKKIIQEFDISMKEFLSILNYFVSYDMYEEFEELADELAELETDFERIADKEYNYEEGGVYDKSVIFEHQTKKEYILVNFQMLDVFEEFSTIESIVEKSTIDEILDDEKLRINIVKLSKDEIKADYCYIGDSNIINSEYKNNEDEIIEVCLTQKDTEHFQFVCKELDGLEEKHVYFKYIIKDLIQNKFISPLLISRYSDLENASLKQIIPAELGNDYFPIYSEKE